LELVEACCSSEPSERPKIQDVIEKLTIMQCNALIKLPTNPQNEGGKTEGKVSNEGSESFSVIDDQK
jgi:hypothetical protein